MEPVQRDRLVVLLGEQFRDGQHGLVPVRRYEGRARRRVQGAYGTGGVVLHQGVGLVRRQP
ncbi:hypothetical protein [Streptomyces sp. NPDC094049]|uniref:hypothetical protein n=1 Tax=Streptomyces sp. NPDC094049 TaxID=3154987 RepID=UPI003323BD95